MLFAHRMNLKRQGFDLPQGLHMDKALAEWMAQFA
ncbi:MAG: hypothetical protein ETSY1_16315 [Candidatus Entotheonella factor]|uniref:Uncharacterized protein n=1 Tax=Entotheonella factor TaxID=1429438 RepID=W4LM66_ENTF1|nr:MAG: hypothetical protein ETSY1_16315 [Candidatus Entotheonella factor]